MVEAISASPGEVTTRPVSGRRGFAQGHATAEAGDSRGSGLLGGDGRREVVRPRRLHGRHPSGRCCRDRAPRFTRGEERWTARAINTRQRRDPRRRRRDDGGVEASRTVRLRIRWPRARSGKPPRRWPARPSRLVPVRQTRHSSTLRSVSGCRFGMCHETGRERERGRDGLADRMTGATASGHQSEEHVARKLGRRRLRKGTAHHGREGPRTLRHHASQASISAIARGRHPSRVRTPPASTLRRRSAPGHPQP